MSAKQKVLTQHNSLQKCLQRPSMLTVASATPVAWCQSIAALVYRVTHAVGNGGIEQPSTITWKSRHHMQHITKHSMEAITSWTMFHQFSKICLSTRNQCDQHTKGSARCSALQIHKCVEQQINMLIEWHTQCQQPGSFALSCQIQPEVKQLPAPNSLVQFFGLQS